MANRIVVALAVLLAALYIYTTEQFPVLTVSDPLGPKAFPRLLGIGLLLTAAALLLETFRANKSEHKRQKTSTNRRHYLVVAGIVAWTTLYVAVFEPLGYALSTSIYLLALFVYFDPGKWARNILTSILYGFISYWMFSKLLDVSLPRGIVPL